MDIIEALRKEVDNPNNRVNALLVAVVEQKLREKTGFVVPPQLEELVKKKVVDKNTVLILVLALIYLGDRLWPLLV